VAASASRSFNTSAAKWVVGKFLPRVPRSACQNNTIVIFVSDHGFHLGEKRHWQKATLWEEATHCLMMIRVPGVTPTGEMCPRFVSLQDIYPTLVSLCALEPKGKMDGRSLRPLLQNPRAEWASTAISGLTSKANPLEAYLSLRNAQGRYIRYGDGQEAFSDSSADPHEWNNAIDDPDSADVIAAFRDALPERSAIARPLPPVRRR
jgi:arylsulfatase A-like enzyme